MIQIDSLTVGMFQSNCYIVSCPETNDAVIVDAGDEAHRILDTVATLGVSVKAVINTHAHLDHVAGLPGVVEALGVPVWMHRADMPVYESVEQQAAMFDLAAPGRVEIDRFLEDGEVVRIGNLEAKVVLTPGHSPGSVCLLFEGTDPARIICGDVLFKGSIGRTDLPGGDHQTLVNTLTRSFLPLSDDTVVYPGHGPATTMGNEKATNPFVAPLVRRFRA